MFGRDQYHLGSFGTCLSRTRRIQFGKKMFFPSSRCEIFESVSALRSTSDFDRKNSCFIVVLLRIGSGQTWRNQDEYQSRRLLRLHRSICRCSTKFSTRWSTRSSDVHVYRSAHVRSSESKMRIDFNLDDRPFSSRNTWSRGISINRNC